MYRAAKLGHRRDLGDGFRCYYGVPIVISALDSTVVGSCTTDVRFLGTTTTLAKLREFLFGVPFACPGLGTAEGMCGENFRPKGQ